MAIIKSVQNAVDEYIQLHQEAKQIEARLKELRGIIEPFMDTKNLEVIRGSEGGGVAIQKSLRSPMSSKYTMYELDAVSHLLSPKVMKKVVTNRIDKDLLEAVIKLGEAPQEILSLKIASEVKSFTIKK